MHVVKRAFAATVSHTSLYTAAVHKTTPLFVRPLSSHTRASRQAAHWQETTRAATKQMTNNTSSINNEISMQPEGSAAAHWPAPKLAKRKVALFVAYVGSSFRGLQLQTQSLGGTVEDVLQQAIFDMGGILPSNYGTLQKVGWSRSSRTDKGVHALANVLAMKLECDPASFESDPEGTQLAAAMNAHLPPEVRVLSVQRVNGGFNARGFCRTRTYHYYLPATILGLTGDDQDQARMDLLRECCTLYRGNNPFHNYTKRKLYRLPAATQPAYDHSRSRQLDDTAAALQHLHTDSDQPQQPPPAAAQQSTAQQSPAQSSSGNTSGDDDWELVSPAQPENGDSALPAQQAVAQEAAPGRSQDTAEASQQPSASEAQRLPRPLQYRWQDEMDPQDMLAKAHYRYINDITVHDPVPLGPAQTLAVKVSITGSSFMLHQIRHMIGAAVAVARGNLPLDFVSASLCAPARTALPLAPSEVLVLADNTFQPFPTDTSAATTALQALSGDVLHLRESGLHARNAFEQEVLSPALEKLLEDSIWADWDAKLDLLCWQDDELAQFTHKAHKWRTDRAAITRAKQQQIAEAQC